MMRWLCFSLLLVACGPTPPKPPDPPPTPGGATCETACARLRQLNCAEARPTAEGATCEQVCQNVMDSGVITWHLDCRTLAASCKAIDACEQ